MAWRRVVFGLACAAWVLMLPVAIFMAVMSPSLARLGTGPALVVLIGNFESFPLACLLAPVAAWIARKKGRQGLSWAIIALPLLWIGAPAVIWSGVLPHAVWSSLPPSPK